MMQSASLWFSAALFLAAGLYQFSPLKERCLDYCRSPDGFILSEWRDGALGAMIMGLRHGLFCMGCCAALMALLFAVAVMDLRWVAALTVLVTAEKLLPGAKFWRVAIGVAWIAAGAGFALGDRRGMTTHEPSHSAGHRRGVVCAPHAAAVEDGRAILAEGGNAIEAMIAMAASIAAVYPHMNHIGGDGFWLIREPQGPRARAMGAGRPARRRRQLYREHGHDEIPSRGPLAALTVPGAVAAWMLALEGGERAWRQACRSTCCSTPRSSTRAKAMS